MAPRNIGRRLIVNADDFGCSPAINQAVIDAHERGILTGPSLMINGAAAEEAISLARAHPRLGVGLHLTLVEGQASLPPDRIPGLADEEGRFKFQSVWAGWRYFWNQALREQLQAEIEAQLRRFQETGLPLDHLDGHQHMHLHPTVLPLVLSMADRYKITHVRLTRDPLKVHARLGSGRWIYALSHAVVFGWLARRVRPALQRHRIRFADAVFGLLQHGRVDEAYLDRLLNDLPNGQFEVYSHPSLDKARHEWEALVSPHIQFLAQERQIQLIGYQDLC